LASEADLRAARWDFLRGVAERFDGVVCTAHTADDQIETVLMRILRGAGARGLAALSAESGIARPLLGFSRTQLLRYARRFRVQWIEDPSNGSAKYLRNRLRRDVLPALRQVRPSIDAELLEV
jgi:tRNA(Ile)-lysidine synthase